MVAKPMVQGRWRRFGCEARKRPRINKTIKSQFFPAVKGFFAIMTKTKHKDGRILTNV